VVHVRETQMFSVRQEIKLQILCGWSLCCWGLRKQSKNSPLLKKQWGSSNFPQFPALASILRHCSTSHTLSSYSLKVIFNIIMPSTGGSPKLSLLQYFDRNFVHFSHFLHAYYAARLSIPVRYNYSTNNWWRLK